MGKHCSSRISTNYCYRRGQDNDVEDEEISDDFESPSQDKNTDERVDTQVLEPASPFAVISNDSFEEDESEEEKVDSVSKNLYLH